MRRIPLGLAIACFLISGQHDDGWTLSVNAAEPSQHVVVVSLDGLAAYLIDDPKVPLPTLRKLAREGAIVDGGMTVSNPSVTWPNHTTLITGVRPE